MSTVSSTTGGTYAWCDPESPRATGAGISSVAGGVHGVSTAALAGVSSDAAGGGRSTGAGTGGAAACGTGMLIIVAGSPSVSPAARATRSATTSGVATSPALAMASSSEACASIADANGPPRRSARVSQLTMAGCSGCVRPSAPISSAPLSSVANGGGY